MYTLAYTRRLVPTGGQWIVVMATVLQVLLVDTAGQGPRPALPCPPSTTGAVCRVHPGSNKRLHGTSLGVGGCSQRACGWCIINVISRSASRRSSDVILSPAIKIDRAIVFYTSRSTLTQNQCNGNKHNNIQQNLHFILASSSSTFHWPLFCLSTNLPQIGPTSPAQSNALLNLACSSILGIHSHVSAL
jgi:hypothetical protein